MLKRKARGEMLEMVGTTEYAFKGDGSHRKPMARM
jgi:hypothetical protein